MRTLDFYLDTARERHRIPSDRQLCKRLGLSTPTVTGWRTKRQWPNDESMLKLALLAGLDPHTALLDLNTWRATGAAQNAYREILATIGAACIAGLIFTAAAPAYTGTYLEHTLNSQTQTVYYGKFLIIVYIAALSYLNLFPNYLNLYRKHPIAPP